MKTYLNLGCGARYHPAWTNIDIAPQSPEVILYDLSRGIPFPDASFEVVYHAAVLEHIRRTDVPAFLSECYRVLRPGGIIRIGVPDLEQLCRLYLKKLESALAGDQHAARDYDWILLELYDQTVRERSGGSMAEYLAQDPLPNAEFVYARIGEEGRQIVAAMQRRTQATSQQTTTTPPLWRRLRGIPSKIKRRTLEFLLGPDGMRALEIGRFRLAGQVHHWMYDRYSLARLLLTTGFHSPIVQPVHCSSIADWMSFNLDTLPDGTTIKPDLFFMEALKPGANTP